MPPLRNNKPAFDVVRFELDKLMTDYKVTLIQGSSACKDKKNFTLSCRPVAAIRIDVELEDYPALQSFVKRRGIATPLRDVIELFLYHTIRQHRSMLRDHLKAESLLVKIRPGGCVSFDTGPDKRYKHVTFGVPRAAT